MGFFSTIKDWFKKTFGRREDIQEEPKEEIIDLKDVENKIEKVKESQEVDLDQIEEQDLSPKESKYNIKSKIRPKLEAPQIVSKSDLEEVTMKLTDKVITTRFYGTKEDLINNKFDIYRNIIMGAIKEDSIANLVYSNGILKQRIVAYLRIIGTITDKRGGKVRIVDEVVEVARFTPDDALEKGIYDFIGYHNTIDNFRREFRGRFGDVGMSYINIKEANSNDILDIKEIKVSFDFK